MDTSQEATQADVNEAPETAVQEPVPETQIETPDLGWMFAAGVKGEGDKPDWFKSDKYETISDQAKAYKDLESRFGSFTGAPEEFTVNLTEELQEKGIEIDSEDPLLEEAIKFAKESQMSQEGFDKMINLYAMAELARENALAEFKESEIKSLGSDAQSRIDNLSQWGKANLPEDLFQGFQEMAASANAIKAMEKLVAMTRNAPISPENANPAPNMDAEELTKMQFEKDEYGNRRIQTDKTFKARYEKLKAQVWGSEEHRQIIGG